MDRAIRPLWRDVENLKHRSIGFAFTVRYLPANEAIHAVSIEDYLEKKKHWYSNLASNSGWMPHLQKYDFIAMDCDTQTDVGFIGSENSIGWMNNGAVGVVTNGGARDTDEVIRQHIAVYSKYVGRGIRPGRIFLDGYGMNINVGGVLVRPGDLIVADGDGVVVVPVEKVYDVVKVARAIADGDKAKRRGHYEKAGYEADATML
jgi:regulator of RNase E activity RraA